jgi:hypothetical protein
LKRVRIIGETFTTDAAKEGWGVEGRTLGSYLAEAANGVDLLLDDPYGLWHTVSLAPFAAEDPDRWMLFYFLTSRDDGGFRSHPALDRGAVVLLEYDLPADAQLPASTEPDDGDGTLLKKYELPPGVKMLERADL